MNKDTIELSPWFSKRMIRNYGQIKRTVKIKKRYTLSPYVLNLTLEQKKWAELSKRLRKRVRKYGV